MQTHTQVEVRAPLHYPEQLQQELELDLEQDRITCIRLDLLPGRVGLDREKDALSRMSGCCLCVRGNTCYDNDVAMVRSPSIVCQ